MTPAAGPALRLVVGEGHSLLPYAASVHERWLEQLPDVPWVQQEATLVFADVSGFTPLTEKLAKRGKVGAEDLTDVLNSVFGSLLSVAAEQGGDCLKFGGDALLLLFSGEGHAERAASAAGQMLEALRPYKRLRTEAGVVSLGMSIGVHTGHPLLVLAGTTHRELMVLGPDVTATLEAEAAAESGEVRISDRASVVPLQAYGAPVAVAAPDIAPAALAVSAQLRPHLTGAVHEGEHRVAVIGFLQFAETDEVLAAGGPDDLALAVDELIGTVQRACDEHGVTFISSDVDKGAGKVILASGVPSASSDDELRLVAALRAITSAGTRLPVRAGVARGRIFAVDLGSAQRRTFTVMGDAVNLAARIMGKAAWRTVWAAADVGEKVADRFELEEIAPFPVKGKAEPVHAVAVGEARASSAAPVTHQRVLGRDAELERIDDLLIAARDGSGVVVEVVGGAGIGKSTLVGAAVERAVGRGFTVWTLEAGRYSQMTPFYALRAPLRGALEVDPTTPVAEVTAKVESLLLVEAPHLRPWIPLLGPPLGIDIPDTPETARLEPALRPAQTRLILAALVRAFHAAAALVVVEDGHWLDSATADLLVELTAQVSDLPWVLLVSRRPVEGGLVVPDDAPQLRLELLPLSEAAADALVRAEVARAGAEALPPGMVERLVSRADGNPLFLIELTRAAARGLEELPDTVEAVIASTIDTLSGDDRDLLRRAAVLGFRFPPEILARLLSVPRADLQARLDSVGDFIEPAGGDLLRFRHVLLRDVAYEGLPFRRRRDLHARAGTIIEASTDDPDNVAELLSTHFHLAGRFEQSWRYSCAAGARSERTAAPVEAALFYRRALDAARHLPDVAGEARAEVTVSLGDVESLAGRYPGAREAYKAARALRRGDALVVGDLDRRIGNAWMEEGRMSETLRACRRGLSLLDALEAGPDVATLRAKLLVTLAGAKLRQGRHLQARTVLQEAVAAVDGLATPEARATLAHAYRLLDWVHMELGDDAPVPYRELSLQLYEELGDDMGRANALNNMGVAAYVQSRWTDAVELYGRSLDAARSAGALVFQALVLNNIGEVRSDQGHLIDAEVLFREAVEIWQGARGVMLGMGLGNLGRVAMRAGRLEEAAELYAQSREVCTRLGQAAMLLDTDARDAERMLHVGQPAAALALADDVADRAVKLGGNPYVLTFVDRVAGSALVLLGEADRGRERIERSLERSRGVHFDFETALHLESLAAMSRRSAPEEADALAVEAMAIFERLGVVHTPSVPLGDSADLSAE